MKAMRIVAQLIDQKTGQRTPPVAKERREFANALRDLYPAKQGEKTFVLVLADDSVKPGDIEFSLAPLLTVTHFIELFSDKAQKDLEV